MAKLNSDATALTYATYLGGTGSEYGQSLALGSGGVVYVAGYTNSTNFPATGGAFQTSHGGGTYDAFLAKLSADATSLGYATYLGGSGDDFGYNVRVNTGGEAFVTGYTHSTNFPTANAFQPSNGGGGNSDIFVSTMNSSGSDLLYSSYLGTSTGEFGYGIALDSSGNAYITGRAESSSFPTSPGAYQTTYGGSGDAVVVKIIASSDNPVPEIASLSPDSGPRGGPDFALTVNGSPFVSNSVVRWNGSDRTTTFINNFKLQATIPASDISAPGTAEVTVFTPTPGGGLSSGITFTILSPEVGLSPRAMDFDPRVISSTSDAQPITLTNTGSAPLTINSIDISGSEAADFGKSHNCPISPSTLAAGDPCTINITFTPAAIGPRKAVLLFSSDAPGSPHRAMLTGLGSAVDLSPGSWDFGSQTVNISSAAKAFTLSNLGGTPIHVWKAAMSGVNAVDFHQTNDCPTPPSTLAGGASCTFNVTFQPTALGARAATLGISHDGGGSPSSVSLTGTGASALQTQAADSPVLVVPMILPGTAQIPEDTDSSADGKRKAKAKTTKERTERQ